MFNKLSIKSLIILLLILLVVVLAIKYFDSKNGDRTFRKELVTIDTAKVDELRFLNLSDDSKTVNLIRSGNNWQLMLGDKLVKADNKVVNNILAMLIKIQPERVAATDRSQWDKYEVGDSTGLQVQINQSGELVSDLIIGKFSYQQPDANAPQNPYQQQKGKMTSYVRLNKDDIVYAVDGYLKMNFTLEINNYRDKALVNVNKNDITALKFEYPADSSFVMLDDNGKWIIDGITADSIKVIEYLTSISRLNNYDFVDDVQHHGQALYSMTIEGNNFLPVIVTAFPADTINRFIIESSANPDGKFSGSKSGLADKIFVGQSKFMN